MRRGLVLLAALAAHGGTAAAEANQTLEYLLELTASSRPHWMAAGGPAAPGGVAFDCSWRKLAMAYAPKLQALSAAKAVELHDALELSALCGVARPPQPAPSRSHASRSQAPAPGAAAAADDAIISVSPTGAVKTLEAALAKARGMSCRPGCAVTIEMGSGIYRLKSAPSAHAGLPAASVVLTPADSGITIAAAAGVEDAVLSGGVELQGLAWKASPGNPKVHVAALTASQAASLPGGDVPALRVGGQRATRVRCPCLEFGTPPTPSMIFNTSAVPVFNSGHHQLPL
eukprot:SAG31_NODE_1943_length_6856_cov_8.165458_8_plen_287_part_00